MVDGSSVLLADDVGVPRQRSCGPTSAAPTCSTPARLLRHLRASPTARHMAIGAIEPQFYAELLKGLGLDGADLPGAERHGPLARTARGLHRGVRRARSRSLGQGVRRHRRLRDAGAVVRRGESPSRTSPSATRSTAMTRTTCSRCAGAAVLAQHRAVPTPPRPRGATPKLFCGTGFSSPLVRARVGRRRRGRKECGQWRSKTP